MTTPLWTKADLQAGLCGFADVGTARPLAPASNCDAGVPTPADMPDLSGMTDAEISATATRILRTATIEVFQRVGAQDWLHDLARTDPKNFLRLLQRLLPQTIEQTLTVQPFVVPEAIRSLTLDDLRAMRAAPDIIDGEYTVTR
jgi:hypothetical protein